MFSSKMRGMRRGLLPLALGSIWIAPVALAQDRAGLPAGAVVQPMANGAGGELRRNLTTLAQNPRSVSALNGAGAAALEMGDADAALNFYGRAADADPQSARARAGMAQALVRLERASEALPLFTEALRLGAPESLLAADRGLAWDMLGFPARAQADYTLALRREDDPEVRRRLALSLAISGQRAEALRVIDAQLRTNDRAAWRTQAFILALTGDAAGAGRTAREMMPAAADALSPFLQRLASLSPSQKALAVHFGRFPSDGRAERYAQADVAPDPGALAMAQGSVPMGQARIRSRSTSPLEAAAPRRRPGTDDTRLTAQIRPAPARSADAAPRRQYSAPSFAGTGSAGAGEGGPARQYASAQSGAPAPAWPTPVLDERQNSSPGRPPSPPPPGPSPNSYPRQDNSSSPGFSLVPQGRALGRAPEAAPPRQAERPLADFSIVTAAVDELKDEEPTEVAAPVRSQPAATARRTAARAQAPSSGNTRNRSRQTPAQANPSRVWVQVATGANRAGLNYSFGQFRERAPALLNGRAAYITPWNATNRMLVGPFPNEAAANAFVRQLSARGVQSYSWTSEAGQRIDQLVAAANEPRSTARTRTAASQRSDAGGRNGRGTAARNARNEPTAGSRTRNRTGAAGSRAGRNSAASTRSARAASSNERGSSRTARNGKPPANASARSSRGGSSGQQRSSTRRGR